MRAVFPYICCKNGTFETILDSSEIQKVQKEGEKMQKKMYHFKFVKGEFSLSYEIFDGDSNPLDLEFYFYSFQEFILYKERLYVLNPQRSPEACCAWLHRNIARLCEVPRGMGTFLFHELKKTGLVKCHDLCEYKFARHRVSGNMLVKHVSGDTYKVFFYECGKYYHIEIRDLKKIAEGCPVREKIVYCNTAKNEYRSVCGRWYFFAEEALKYLKEEENDIVFKDYSEDSFSFTPVVKENESQIGTGGELWK